LGIHDDSKQEARSVENQPAALQGNCSQIMRDNKGFAFSLATANMLAYQASFLDMTQDNMHLSFDLVQRLATIRSPFEIPAIVAKFTKRRIDMLWKYSKEMAESGSLRSMF